MKEKVNLLSVVDIIICNKIYKLSKLRSSMKPIAYIDIKFINII